MTGQAIGRDTSAIGVKFKIEIIRRSWVKLEKASKALSLYTGSKFRKQSAFGWTSSQASKTRNPLSSMYPIHPKDLG